jgi:hypothetical protein
VIESFSSMKAMLPPAAASGVAYHHAPGATRKAAVGDQAGWTAQFLDINAYLVGPPAFSGMPGPAPQPR